MSEQIEQAYKDRIQQLEWEVEKLTAIKGDPNAKSFTLEELAAPFNAMNELEWRVQSCGGKGEHIWAKIIPYITRTAVMNRLDKVVGFENWQDRYEFTENGVLCSLSIRIHGEWITKSDGAPPTQVESFKGAISDALKRAATKFGIGRYLSEGDGPIWASIHIPKPSDKESVLYEKGWHRAQTKDKETFFWHVPSNIKL